MYVIISVVMTTMGRLNSGVINQRDILYLVREMWSGTSVRHYQFIIFSNLTMKGG